MTSGGEGVDALLLEILACPACHASLNLDDESAELRCTNRECRRAYPIRDGIPILLVDEARIVPEA